MAIQATHLNLFEDRQSMNPTNQGNVNYEYNSQQMDLLGLPFTPSSLPEKQSLYETVNCDAMNPKNTVSGLTYNVPASRKRSRDSNSQFYDVPNYPASAKRSSFNTFSGEHVLPQYQLEIDAIVSQHTEKIRLEVQKRQKHQAKMIAAALAGGVMKKLMEKDEQIQRICKLNLALQERIKSLYVENQLWRELAQSNEVMANSLRTNLEQVLLHADNSEEKLFVGGEEDAESCCGSSEDHVMNALDKDDASSSYSDRTCKMCGERESCVLLLPCRHLCLCSVCGSGSRQLQSCPVCNSSMNATLHVNMS